MIAFISFPPHFGRLRRQGAVHLLCHKEVMERAEIVFLA